MIYLLGAVGLKPGGSITIHIYTHTQEHNETIHRTYITIRMHKCNKKSTKHNVRVALVQ